MKYEEICIQAIEIIKNAGAFILEESQKFSQSDVEVKSANSFVTYVDKHSERMLVEELQKLVPQAGFIAEEETVSHRGEKYNWIIDPLDGTTNFIHKLPPFAISVALNEGNETVIGIVYELTQNEMFYTWKGAKSFLNGKEIHMSAAATLKDSLIATGFPYYDFQILKAYLAIIEEVVQTTQGVRRIGSAATDLAYVACGRFEVFFEHSLNPWDVAAGALLVQNAGGRVTDFSGDSNYLFGREIIATNNNVYNEFLSLVRSKIN